MSTFSCDRYNEFLFRVVEWNRVAKGGERVTEDSVRLQREVTSEEIKETEEAIKNNDKKETLDGIADVFVTAGYLNYMKTGNPEATIFSLRDSEQIDPLRSLQLIDYERSFSPGGPSHYEIQKLYAWACSEYGQEEVDNYFDRVLLSNESKFVPVSEWDEKHEIKTATKKYAEKGFNNIVSVDATFNGNPVKVLRAEGGKGKVLKPTTFQEP